MRIEVVDPGMHALGLALGFVEAGHEVRYVRGSGGPAVAPGSFGAMSAELISRFLGGGVFWHEAPDAPDDVDLVVIADVFADILHCLHQGSEPIGSVSTGDPMRRDASAALYPARLQRYAARALSAARVVIVDMSDRREHREVLFERVPGAVLFAREGTAVGDGPWRPFPFLYNQVILWLERCAEREGWWFASPRATRWDWVFCGTVAHERYGRRREQALRRLRALKPNLRAMVLDSAPFEQVLRTIQLSRFTLDLPGVGDVCFRMHESLALGVPLFRPDTCLTPLPEGLKSVVVPTIDADGPRDPDSVRAVYERCYAPCAAAEHLLNEVLAVGATR